MNYYPYLNELNTSRDMTNQFYGYNHNDLVGQGEFFDMKNLSSRNYPLLSPRLRRGKHTFPSNVEHNLKGLACKDALCYVDNGKLYIGDLEVAGLDLDPNTEKTLVSMGAYLVIFPDKKYINTKDYSDKGNIEATYISGESSTVSFTLSKQDGEAYTDTNASSGAPSPDENDNYPLWIDTSGDVHSLKQYNPSTAMWVTVPTTYIKISATGIGIPFKAGDGITISGVSNPALKDLNSTMVIQDKGDDYIVVIGMLDANCDQSSQITVSRKMPIVDFVIESGNRLWGCRYGENINGDIVNEIYASKLGDFKNWNSYLGVTTDSYTASCGTDGQWTGAISFLGQPLFFKENCMHKVYGNYPANYQIQATTCRGVQKGSYKSMAIVNETLLYKSRNGVCAYTGSLPEEASAVFGGILYHDAVAGACGDKYYISMLDESNASHLFVYDSLRGQWYKEDELRPTCFCGMNNEMYAIVGADIVALNGSGAEYEGLVEWEAITGILGTELPDQKYISRVNVRMSCEVGATVTISAQYDGENEWHQLTTYNATTLRSISMMVRPRRCDHFRLKISGTGDAKIFSITKTTEQGSDVT